MLPKRKQRLHHNVWNHLAKGCRQSFRFRNSQEMSRAGWTPKNQSKRNRNIATISLGLGVKYCHSTITILEKMGLHGKVEPQQAKNKWDNFKKKYKDCRYLGTEEGVSGKHRAAAWPWFVLMVEVLGQRPSIAPPSLRTHQGQVPTGDQEEEDDDNDKRLQREAGERREQRAER
ncbi:uncharacterized protein AB9X84_006067 [Acanthopagrus schlegelii]